MERVRKGHVAIGEEIGEEIGEKTGAKIEERIGAKKAIRAVGVLGAIGLVLCVASTAASAATAGQYAAGPLHPSYPSYYTTYTLFDTPTPLVSAYTSTDPARTRAEINAWQYNTDYLFGLSRGTAGSAILPAFKVFVFILTVPLDIALLPFAAIGGLFG